MKPPIVFSVIAAIWFASAGALIYSHAQLVAKCDVLGGVVVGDYCLKKEVLLERR